MRLMVLVMTVVLTGSVSTVAGASAGPSGQRGSAERLIRHDQWRGADLAQGSAKGAKVSNGVVAFTASQATVKIKGAMYESAKWTSPKVVPGFGLTQLIASWNADTPGGSFVRIQVRGRTAKGPTGWDTIADWAAGDSTVKRTTFGSQTDGGASMNVDTWVSTLGVTQWQLRVRLFRPVGSTVVPTLRSVGAVASRISGTTPSVSTPRNKAKGVVLDVPGYSQMIHKGEYPQYGGGGNAWCSPTATSMVLSYYNALPKPAAYRWVDTALPDRFVAHGARSTYDWSYGGTGNWPFNTAYAGTRTTEAFVTRLANMRDVESFILAGIPVIISIAFDAGELNNAPIKDTDGHLIVVVGFNKLGNVVVNDPAAASNKTVRRTYNRAQLEKVWLEASDGVAYIIRDQAHPLPKATKIPRW